MTIKKYELRVQSVDKPIAVAYLAGKGNGKSILLNWENLISEPVGSMGTDLLELTTIATDITKHVPKEAIILAWWDTSRQLGLLSERNTLFTSHLGQPFIVPSYWKDRAGVIGSVALRGLLEELTASGASVRLIGHSFGARVVLAALSTATLAAKVRSALLLQPAVNQFCFADAGRIPKSQNAGGFRKALDQLELPLYTTFSAKDFPLHDTFHLALRRAKDLGEAEIAAGAAPSVYCALGGYGPSGLADCGVARTQIEDTGSYAIAQGARILALDGTQGRINGHGDVTNPCTWWALIDQDQRATQARGHNP